LQGFETGDVGYTEFYFSSLHDTDRHENSGKRKQNIFENRHNKLLPLLMTQLELNLI
jgi:hypothetical protein